MKATRDDIDEFEYQMSDSEVIWWNTSRLDESFPELKKAVQDAKLACSIAHRVASNVVGTYEIEG